MSTAFLVLFCCFMLICLLSLLLGRGAAALTVGGMASPLLIGGAGRLLLADWSESAGQCFHSHWTLGYRGSLYRPRPSFGAPRRGSMR